MTATISWGFGKVVKVRENRSFTTRKQTILRFDRAGMSSSTLRVEKVSSVPAWFDEANGYSKNQHPGALYDLKADLDQSENLFTQQPERVKELKSLLSKIRKSGEVR